MNEQRFYHTCGQEIWRLDGPSAPLSFGYQLAGELVRASCCPHCQAELSSNVLHASSDQALTSVQTQRAPTSASLHSVADQLIDAAEQMEDRAGTMRGLAENLRQQGDQIV
jgi:hypothetical protein